MNNRETTHAQGCWSWDPRHYECALKEIEALRAEVVRLRTDLMVADEIREKLGHLLTRTAAALKGEPPAGVLHSWHDLLEKAIQLAEALRDESHDLRKWAETSWNRGFQQGLEANRLLATQAVDALKKEREAHAETNRAMTEALLVMEEREQRDKALLRQALDTLAYWLEHGETPGAHDMIQRTHDALQERLK